MHRVANRMATRSGQCARRVARRRLATSGQAGSSSSGGSSCVFDWAALGTATALTATAGWLLWPTRNNSAHADDGVAAAAATATGAAADAASDAASSDPADSATLFKYVIVGAGTAGYNAYLAIRELDPDGTILIVSEESEMPYDRPPLSKELWTRRVATDDDVARTLAYRDYVDEARTAYQPLQAALAADKYCVWRGGTSVADMDADAKALLLNESEVVFFEQCLLATGATPRRLDTLTADGLHFDLDEHAQRDNSAASRVTTYRRAADFRRLDDVARDAKHVAVVGGSFLACELASALRSARPSLRVTQLFPERAAMAAHMPADVADRLSAELTRAGVDLRPNTLVRLLDRSEPDSPVVVHTDTDPLEVDHVVLAVGVRPQTDVARLAGLELDKDNHGIMVNSELAARTGIYAAGDVASYPDAAVGRRRVEHYDHAAMSGRTAGRNMTGKRERYTHVPMFWGGVGDVKYEAVGRLDSKLETIGFWDRDNFDSNAPRGVVYYMDENRVVGVLLCNVDGKVDAARRVVSRKKAFFDKTILRGFISLED